MLICLSLSGGSSPPGLVEVEDGADSAALVRQAVLSLGDTLKRVTPAAPGVLSDWAIQCTEQQGSSTLRANRRSTRVVSRETAVRTILNDPPDQTNVTARSLRLVYTPNAVQITFVHVPHIPNGTTHTLYLAADMTVADIIDVLVTEIGLRKVVLVGHKTSRVDYRL